MHEATRSQPVLDVRLATVDEARAGDASDPQVELEQRRLDESLAALEAMRHRSEGLLAELRAAGKPDLDYEAALLRRVALLQEGRRPLPFGRIDESGGTIWRIGRRHVEDPGGEPLVIDWRAPVAVPFYRARPGTPLGLRRRRQILVEGGRVLAVADDLFGGGSSEVATTRLRGGDALLAELERARTGEMLDIVAPGGGAVEAHSSALTTPFLPGSISSEGPRIPNRGGGSDGKA